MFFLSGLFPNGHIHGKSIFLKYPQVQVEKSRKHRSSTIPSRYPSCYPPNVYSKLKVLLCILLLRVWCRLSCGLQTTPEGNPLPDTKGSSFFTYDRIFDEDSSTQEVYEGVARDLVHSVVRGMNSTIFAYGQTSSGKTFTMQGGGTKDSPGIVQMATQDLFNLMDATPDRVFLMRVSYLEIYQEDIKDLLRRDISKLQVRCSRIPLLVDCVVSGFSWTCANNVLSTSELLPACQQAASAVETPNHQAVHD